MPNSYVFYQGNIVKEDEVSISIRSKAFNYGLGCFEGIRAYWCNEQEQLFLFKGKEHFERLLKSCKIFNITLPYTADELCDITVELLKKNNYKTSTYIRPVAYKGSNLLNPTFDDDDDRLVIYCQPLGKFAAKDMLRVAVSSWRRISDNMIPARAKPTGVYLNSALASLEAHQGGYDDAIMLNDKGFVCEGPSENIFLMKNGQLLTPPPSDNILEGITRELVIELAKEELGIEVVERSIGRAELYAADEAFFSGTAMEVTGISEIDGRLVGDGTEGEVYSKIKELFFGLTTGKNPKYASCCQSVY